MPGGEVDPRSVQFAAQMKMWRSKRGSRPDKHALRCEGEAKRNAVNIRVAKQMKEDLRKNLWRLFSQIPKESDFARYILWLLRHFEKIASKAMGTLAAGHWGASSGSGGLTGGDQRGRGPTADMGRKDYLESAWWNKKNDNGIADAANHLKGEPQNPSRRGVISKGIATLVAAGTILSGAPQQGIKAAADHLNPNNQIEFGIDANALEVGDFDITSKNPVRIKEILKNLKFDKKEIELTSKLGVDLTILPPGYAHCRDKVLALIYGSIAGTVQNFDGYSLRKRIERNIGDKNQQVLAQTQFLEPGFYFAIEKISKSNSFTTWSELLPQINLPLAYFEKGTHNYFSYWHRRHIRNMWTSPQEIEINFLNSIFAAAYMREDLAVKETQNFLKLTSMQEKAVKLQEVMKILSSLPKDKTSADPENGYNRCLVAMWSSFLLVMTYDQNGNKTAGNLLYENLEKNTRKLLNHPIRGDENHKYKF